MSALKMGSYGIMKGPDRWSFAIAAIGEAITALGTPPTTFLVSNGRTIQEIELEKAKFVGTKNADTHFARLDAEKAKEKWRRSFNIQVSILNIRRKNAHEVDIYYLEGVLQESGMAAVVTGTYTLSTKSGRLRLSSATGKRRKK